MNDKIIQIDSRDAYKENMTRYSLYVLYHRYIPDIRDGLKPGQRRVLYAMYHGVRCTDLKSKRKSATTVGEVIGKYHPHSDDAVYGSMKSMTNWFEIKVPLINYDSNSGTIQGGAQAAMRYTESYLSKFTMECVIGELDSVKDICDWSKTFDNNTIEPDYLPVKVPLLLVNGTFGIAIGTRIEVPKHSLNDVIDATITLLKNPNADVVLIPDPCHKCELIDTDWKKISNTGSGYYIQRGIVEVEHTNKDIDILHIRSTPDYVFSDNILTRIEELIKERKLIQIADIQDHSDHDNLDIHIILKKGSDPEYVRQVLYKNTALQDSKRVNMQVISDNEITRVSYKAYIMYFIEFRRKLKFRLYMNYLQEVQTRLHIVEVFVKILSNKDVDKIIDMIRNQSSMDTEYVVNWLANKVCITDLQARYILDLRIKGLSKGHLNRYRNEMKDLVAKIDEYTNIITNQKLIDAEIEAELLEIKNKYGAPRRSKIISDSEANGIPSGEFKIVITEQNYVKKLQINDSIRTIKGDNPKYVIIADNSKNLLLFDQLGKVYTLPVHKIMFTDKNSPGVDIRILLKKLTSNIVSVMYLPVLEYFNNKKGKYFIVTISNAGLIKKMDIDDVLTATPSGIIFSKLNEVDKICDVLLASPKSDVVIYTKSKALRLSIDNIPHLKRPTLGNISIKSNDKVDGMSVITSDTKEIIIVTRKGKFNKISEAALNRSDRNKAGSSVIKLSRDDAIISIFPCNGDESIRITTADEVLDIHTANINSGSTISAGVKLSKEIIKAELVRK